LTFRRPRLSPSAASSLVVVSRARPTASYHYFGVMPFS